MNLQQSSSSCRVLTVLAWSVTLLLISSCLGVADVEASKGHPLSKRSFDELQCKGTFDITIFTRLRRICDDCYNLFNTAEVYVLCMEDCFTSKYFKGCVDVLQMQDEIPQIKEWIKQLHGADPVIQ